MYTKEQKLEVLHHVLGVYEKTLKSLVKANKARQEKIMKGMKYGDDYLSRLNLKYGICFYLLSLPVENIYCNIFEFILKKSELNDSGYLFDRPRNCNTYQEVKQTFRNRISWLKQAINHYENS